MGKERETYESETEKDNNDTNNKDADIIKKNPYHIKQEISSS